MQTFKTKNGSSEVPHKTSPITARSSCVSNTTRSRSDSINSKLMPTNSSTERSPKVLDCWSPKSPLIEKKRPIRSSELQSEVTRLEEELKKMKEQLSSCESSKQQLKQEADEIKKLLVAKSVEFEESQLQLLALSMAEDDQLQELCKISQEPDEAWRLKLEVLKKKYAVDSAAPSSAMNEIRRLEQELDAMKSETAQAEDSEMKNSELAILKEEMADTLSTIEDLKLQSRERGLAEEAAKFIVSETQKRLEIAEATIKALRADGRNLLESLNSNPQLEESKVRVDALEEIATEYQKAVEDNKLDRANPRKIECGASQLGAALKAAETKYQEEQIQMTIRIQSAYETAELVKFDAGLRESELESTIEKTKTELSELKGRLFDIEKEVQSISEANKELKEEMKKGEADQFDCELKCELKLMKVTTDVTELKAKLLDKETALQSELEQNEILNSELRKRDCEHRSKYTAAIAEAEKVRAAEKEILKRIGLVEGEADKSGERAVKVLEQLEEAKAVNLEMETEPKRLKVQADQWRKAAEAASAILIPGNNGGRVIEDSDSSSISGKLMSSPFSCDLDDESPKKKNSSVLRKLGGLRKKSPK